MRAWLSGLVVCGIAWIAAGRSWGDEPPFPVPPPKPAGLQLVVKVDPNAAVSRLILPPDAAGEDNTGALLPGDDAALNAPRGEESQNAFFQSPLRSILAGLCLSLAIGAIFFVPRTSGSAQMALVGAVGASMFGIAAAAMADIAPDPVPPRPAIAPLASGPVKVEWTGRKGAPVTLILAGQAMKGGAGVRPHPRRAIPEENNLPRSAPPQP